MKNFKIANIAKTAVFAVAAGAVALGVAGAAEAASSTTYGDPAAAANAVILLGITILIISALTRIVDVRKEL